MSTLPTTLSPPVSYSTFHKKAVASAAFVQKLTKKGNLPLHAEGCLYRFSLPYDKLAYFARGSITSKPVNGRKTSGTTTEPSAC